jgi:hypothetical protein
MTFGRSLNLVTGEISADCCDGVEGSSVVDSEDEEKGEDPLGSLVVRTWCWFCSAQLRLCGDRWSEYPSSPAKKDVE